MIRPTCSHTAPRDLPTSAIPRPAELGPPAPGPVRRSIDIDQLRGILEDARRAHALRDRIEHLHVDHSRSVPPRPVLEDRRIGRERG